MWVTAGRLFLGQGLSGKTTGFHNAIDVRLVRAGACLHEVKQSGPGLACQGRI